MEDLSAKYERFESIAEQDAAEDGAVRHAAADALVAGSKPT